MPERHQPTYLELELVSNTPSSGGENNSSTNPVELHNCGPWKVCVFCGCVAMPGVLVCDLDPYADAQRVTHLVHAPKAGSLILVLHKGLLRSQGCGGEACFGVSTCGAPPATQAF